MPATKAIVNVTPEDRIELIKTQIQKLGDEVDQICQLALNDGRDLSDTENDRIVEIGGASHDGKIAGCLLFDLFAEMDNWTNIRNGLLAREKELASTTPKSADNLAVSEMRGRRQFAMGCNRAVIVPAESRRGYRELEKVGNAWGETRSEREENAYAAGMWFLAHVWPQHDEGSQLPIVAKAINWCRDHGILNQQDTVTPTRGPELIPAPLESAIIEIREFYGVMRRFARVYPMSAKTLDIPKFVDGLTVGLVVELAAQALTEKAWMQINLVAKKAGGYAQWSTEIGEDAIISLAADLSRDFGIAFAEREDFTGFMGDGTTDFANMGITGITEALQDGSIYTAPAGILAFKDLVLGDFESMLGMIPNVAVDPHWFMHKSVYYTAVHPLKTVAGGNTIATLTDGDSVSGGSDFRWLGIEGTFTNVLPQVSDEAANLKGGVILGDLGRGVAFGDRRGVTVRVDNSIRVIEDAVIMTGNSRFDIQTHETGDATTPGVIVQLQFPAV